MMLFRQLVNHYHYTKANFCSSFTWPMILIKPSIIQATCQHTSLSIWRNSLHTQKNIFWNYKPQKLLKILSIVKFTVAPNSFTVPNLSPSFNLAWHGGPLKALVFSPSKLKPKNRFWVVLECRQAPFGS